MHLAALGLLFTTAWADGGVPTGAIPAGLPLWHVVFLLLSGAAAALLTLTVAPAADGEARLLPATFNVSELMAQMRHELRTPLNAVIGFSEVMLRELYGPLGHARYQEYAHHISESGGRLLKCSEQALAFTETMTVLMAGQRARPERLCAGGLWRAAWRRAGAPVRALIAAPEGCEIVCEPRSTLQALVHLLEEALEQGTPDGALALIGACRGHRRELRIDASAAPALASGGSLNVALARLLLEAQGASLALSRASGTWSAVITFPAPPAL